MKMIPFNKPFLFPEGFKAIQEAYEEGKLSGDGLNTRRCVDWFSRRWGYDRCLLTPSCTAALELAAIVLDLKPGDEVIVPSYTFVSVANAFALRGVKIVFCDSEVNTPNLCAQTARKLITPRTKAIVVVHYAGIPIDLSDLLELKIPVVEDCAHAIGSFDTRTRQPIGRRGCMAAFSFHDTKNIGIGEGGMLVVNDEKLWNKAQIVREKGTNRIDFLQGRSRNYNWLSLGSSYLLSEVDAGILFGSLLNFDRIQSKRLAIWNAYNERLSEAHPVFQKPVPDIARANAHMYYLTFHCKVIRKQFCDWMKQEATVSVTTHYLPLNTSPFALEHYSCHDGEESLILGCPRAVQWSGSIVRLPLFYDLSDAELDHVIESVNRFVKQVEQEGVVEEKKA